MTSGAQVKDRLDRRDKLLGWEAVGRLDGPHGHCTAALITRDVALTAAHCVAGKGTGFVFRAGYRDGSAIASRSVVDLVLADGYLDAVARRDRGQAIALDVALVRLSSAIYDPGANPYEIAAPPRLGGQLTLASYGQGRLEALTLERGCALKKRYRDGVVGFDCDATFGSSGAPVFTKVGDRFRIFSVVSSGTVDEGLPKETLGMELSAIVPQMLETLRNRRALAPISNGARRIGVGQGMSGGARFVRPNGS
ncbi:Trypsin domain protein [Candidatus Rhodobacter oscarellae]|uniref:Trypsin domain protein n=2 Tax=Candidatus Rhodobacter oscarellae TaxID=1675527 RepID=A0A0J9E5E5_9RHOB|nr:Trypsin domain protein [Candidatus Rhodobacter lobularis]